MTDRDAQKQTHDRNKGADITEKTKHRKKDPPPDSMTDLDDAGCSVYLLYSLGYLLYYYKGANADT